MKKKFFHRVLSLAMASAMTMGMAITGQAEEAGMSRAEMAAALVAAAGYTQSQVDAYAAETSAFVDVAEDSAYEGAINLAYAKGMMSGVGDNKFDPDAKATMREVAAVLLKMYDMSAYLNTWPVDYDNLAKWSGLTEGMTYTATGSVTIEAMAQMYANGMFYVGERPVIGISWKSDSQNYDSFKQVIYDAGGMPVEMPKITSTAVEYGEDGKIVDTYLMESGNLETEYAEIVKSKDFTLSNVADAVEKLDIDGMFFTGGEDISPSLYAEPQAEANHGEEINATRDISDYTLMAYCIENDIPTFAVCRGQQMMSVVSGSGFVQDIPDYFAAQGVEYPDTHRMPVGAPNRTYARHDVDIEKDSKWLYDIVGSTKLENVSSWHHQMAELPSENLTVVATTTVNGITTIEAVERQDKTFCLGVQFHPENDCVLALNGKEAPCDLETCQQFFETLVAYADDRPVIGISWMYDGQDYEDYKYMIRELGGIPVEVAQVTSTAVEYGEDGMIDAAYIEETGKLKQEYADIIKSKDFTLSNVAEAVNFKAIDGMFFTGGEDISPSLYAVPQDEANHEEDINATRDISDYTLMAYCIEQDIPTFAVCRGQQMMSVVSGSGFVQDIPDYFAANGAEYPDTHRMPVGAPNRTYARHDVDILDNSKWLYDIVGSNKLENVSSWHHQMADTTEIPGENLTVVATTTVNGITTIEAVERQDKTFCLGVQFHPENDITNAIYYNNPDGALCDLDTCKQFFETLIAYADDRPVIGISWMYDGQDYEDYKYMIRMLGGIPVEMPKITSTAVEYGEDGMIVADYLEETGKLKQEAADVVKSKDFTTSNVAEAVAFKAADGMFFTGGEDISPSLYAVPQAEDNEGEEINATRDISDYTLMAYCIANDIPTFAVCRGQQMMSVVSGSSFIQDIPNYFEAKGAEYPDTHRMPVGAPNRTYARHDIEILDNSKWLYDIVGNNVLENVSSWHHQAADMTDVEGTNLTVVAKKEVNGVEIIEAVEVQDNTFCLGVQFHPENDVTNAVYYNNPDGALCNLNTCMNFFRTLIGYAASK